ncbi:PREDICTED: two-component response regulator-like APRR2 isoform X2 [Ipomoea nil]|uniref:two-component response regulator-like APRR2 isoform X2 n=1 Tax=Ipomoea nil TaxID=35883 RepID=UPI00090094D1|nr:PREDICTED: two-component response regulator-like APRR2 isoform X2 [Ipomoea nil]
MLCTANDLLGWKDFPKGLSVLLLDEDSNSAAKMKTKLEEMDYIVSTFQNENEALLAIASKSVEFHVAIVEVNISNSNEVFKFLEIVKDLPTILVSNVYCLNTMMKCIALGAVEFLQKPLSDDKLRNIWQHVVHKAFNAGGKDVESLKPVKESLVSMLQLRSTKNEEANTVNSDETEQSTSVQENNRDTLSVCDKYPAPSTPQLKQCGRSLDDGECHDQTNLSMEQDSVEHDGESKSVETTYCNSVSETIPAINPPVIKQERESSPEQAGKNGNSTCSESKDVRANANSECRDPKKPSGVNSSTGTKANKKKVKVDWTPELHKKFVQAVEQLGLDQAIPSRILEMMKVEGLTRHNIASHLQKYRMHRRQILPKEDEWRWPLSRDSTQRSCYPRKPVMAIPQYHSAPPVVPAGQFYSAWAHPGSYPGAHVWGSPYHYPGWQPTDDWNWKSNTGVYAQAWGCPVMPPPQGSYPTYPQNTSGHHRSGGVQDRYNMLEKTYDFQPAEELIDKVVKEAINNPWLPLPLGLKPPSTDSVLNELSKQGISTIPPQTNGSDLR